MPRQYVFTFTIDDGYLEENQTVAMDVEDMNNGNLTIDDLNEIVELSKSNTMDGYSCSLDIGIKDVK